MLLQIFVDIPGLTLGQLDVDAPQGVDDGGQAVEVDGDVILDVHLEIPVHGPHGQGGAAAGLFLHGALLDLIAAILEGGIDLGLVLVAGDGDQGIPQDRGHLDRSRVPVDGDDDLRVAQADDLLGILAAGIHADEQDVDHVLRQVRVQVEGIGIDARAILLGFLLFEIGIQLLLLLLGEIIGFPGILIDIDIVAVRAFRHFLRRGFLHDLFDEQLLLGFLLLGEGEDRQEQAKGQKQGKQLFHARTS